MRAYAETLPMPWYTGGPMADYYFSEKARKFGYRVYVDHDVSRDVYHLGPHFYGYRDALRDYEAQEAVNG